MNDNIFQDGVYYVHLHEKNIKQGGIEGNNISNDTLASYYRNQKIQAGVAAKKNYISLFKQSLSKNSLDLLEKSFELNEDRTMAEISKAMQESIQEAIPIDKFQNLMGYTKDVNVYKMLSSKGTKKVEEFNKMLEAVSKALNLLDGPDSDKLAENLLLLSGQIKGQNRISNKVFGDKLMKELNKFKNDNEGKTFNPKALDNVISQLENIANGLITGQNKSGDALTFRGYKTLFSNLFSTEFAEGIGAMLKHTATFNIDKELRGVLEGTQTKEVIQYGPDAEFIKSLGKVTGKVDVKYPNVGISMELLDSGETSELNIDLGLSMKFYQNQHFKGINDNIKTMEIHSGSGGTLKEAFIALFGSDIIANYYAYNTFGHFNTMDSAITALQDLILTRQINRLFSTTGTKEDFNQFMIINGEVVSIWDLIQYVINNDVGLTNSQTKNPDSKQAISLSINSTDRQNILNSNKKINNEGDAIDKWVRSKRVNEAINKTKIQAVLHVERLRELV